MFQDRIPPMQQPSLTTVPRHYPVHANINDADGKDTNDAESRIQYYLEAYKHYIVQCINPEDLLFYEHFSIERRKYFRELSNKFQDSIRVTSKMIDTIISMKDVPGRFSALVKLFEDEFENEKIKRILKGEKIPTNRKQNKEKIQKVCSAEICKNLNVTEIIPHLLEEKMISVNEGNEIKNKAERDSPFSASIDLLLKLPHRHPNWYTRFLSCLVKSCHADLAKLVDEELCKKIIQDMPTREKEGKPPVDYRDDFISCVSGSDSMYLKHRKEDRIKSKSSTTSVTLENETGLQDKTTIYTETVVPTECSVENERITVAEWVIASQDIDVNSVRERRSTATNRPYSLICEKPFRKTGSKRHQTLQIPMNQMAIMQKYLLKETSVNHRFDEIPKDAFFCSRSSSMFSSMDSLESMCVDLQVSVDEKKQSCVVLKFIGIPKIFSDLNQNSSDGVQISHEMEENTTTMDVETKSHLDCQRIDRAIQTEAKVKTSNCPNFQQLLTMSFSHPVKILHVVKDNPDIHNLCTILDWMSHRTIELEDYSLSIKAHYVSTVIQAATAAEDIDVFIYNLLTARESDGYFENQDILIRDVIEKYEYKETEIFKTIFAELQLSDTGDGLSSLRILTQILQRNSTGDNNTDSTNNNEIVKKESGCYASEEFEKLNQFTDELSLNTLSLNESCSRNENVTKLKDEMCNTNRNAINENDQLCQVTDLSDTTKESKWKGITKVEEGCNAKESDTMNSNTCKTCNNCMTNRAGKCCTEKTRLKVEQGTRKANNSFEETNDKILTVCAATVVKERYTDKSTVGQVDTNIRTKSKPCGCFIRDEADSISRSDVYLETLPPNSPDYKVIEEQKFKRCGVTIVCVRPIKETGLKTVDGVPYSYAYSDQLKYNFAKEVPERPDFRPEVIPASSNRRQPRETVDDSEVDVRSSDSQNESSDRSSTEEEELYKIIAKQKITYVLLRTITDDFNPKLVALGGRVIGSGGFGDVFLGRFQNGFQVAVKRLKNVEEVDKQFETELNSLIKYRHKNIVCLYGYSVDGPGKCLAYEYLCNGSLEDRLQRKDNTPPLPNKVRLSILQGTAAGIQFLNSKGTVHRDIKSANVLLGENFKPKVGDFATARSGPRGNTTTLMSTQIVIGTSAYLAPEAMNFDVSTKLDSFGFGIVILEVLTALPPLDFNREDKDLKSHVEENNIKDLLDTSGGMWPHDTASKLVEISEKCTKIKKKTRVNVADIMSELCILEL